MPGIDPTELARMMQQNQGGLLDVFNVLAGGAIGRMAIFALGIMPYISASIIIQLMTTVFPELETLKKEGEAGRKMINQYTRYGTVGLAALQAYGIAIGLEHLGKVVIDPGFFFRFSAVITLTGGTMLLMWIGEQITARGVGNGISLIIFAGIVARFPIDDLSGVRGGAHRRGRAAGADLRHRLHRGADPGHRVHGARAAAIAGAISQATGRQPHVRRRKLASAAEDQRVGRDPADLRVVDPADADDGRQFQRRRACPTGCKPSSPISATASRFIWCSMRLLIIFFSFFYTSIVFNPEETAENLKKYGGFIPGIRPGKKTADYIDYVLTRITVVGALYLATVCLIPEFLIYRYNIPFYLGGTSILIVVSVTMDTVAQIQSHLIAQQYEGLIKKAKLRGARR